VLFREGQHLTGLSIYWTIQMRVETYVYLQTLRVLWVYLRQREEDLRHSKSKEAIEQAALGNKT
jgi:hypothetical protein